MMDGEEKALLRKILEMSRENNKMLKKMRRSMVTGRIFKVIFWAVILGVPVAIYYYFLQPYVDQLISIYSGLQSSIDNLSTLPEIPTVEGFLDQFQN